MRGRNENGVFALSMRWGEAGLREESREAARWIWRGYLATGAVTLLTSQWKIGKTTLTSILLARMKRGGTVAGLPVAAGRAIVISEESPRQWLLRCQKLDLSDHVGWFCRPFRERPDLGQWQQLLDETTVLAVERSVSLVVVDPLAPFLPGNSENTAGSMLDALVPLQRLAARGPAVLVLHHPAKKKTNGDGPSGRGSGALLGCADILVEMRPHGRDLDADRRRRLIAASRFDETPRQCVVELDAEGGDYVNLGDVAEVEFADNWILLKSLLLKASRKLNRAEILADWPAEVRPVSTTVYRWLRRAVELGLVRQDGLGQNHRPFRYWLPENEERWREDPIALILMPELIQPTKAKRK